MKLLIPITKFSAIALILSLLSGCNTQITGLFTHSSESRVNHLIRELEEKRNIQTCDGSINVRGEIAEKLGELKDPRSIDTLITILSSPDQDILSSGASGCQPGSKGTYAAAIKALEQFGPEAKQATPRLRNMLLEPDNSRFTSNILSALEKIESDNVLKILLPVYIQIADSTSYHHLYLKAFQSFKNDLQGKKEILAPSLEEITVSSLNNSAKGALLAVLLYSQAYQVNQEQFTQLLSDMKALQWVDARAFANADPMVLRQILTVLDGFDQRFPPSVLAELKATCGPTTIEGSKNYLMGKLFSILIAICTPESLAAIAAYKQEHNITLNCSSSANSCQASLSTVSF